jgi:hypothetical protein
MPDQNWGEATVRIPGACLSPSHLRSLSEKIARKRARLPWRRAKCVGREMVYAPYYYFRYVNPKLRKRFYLYDVLVDGILGFSEFIRGSFELKESSVPRVLLLERTISREQAESVAKRAVGSYALRRQSLWVKKIEVELIEGGELHFPYWVCYLETRKGIELFALNGLTGTPAGPRPENILRAGIARAEWQRERG